MILGKPHDAEDACRMLSRLAGREHEVLTAVAVQQGVRRLAALSVSKVRFAAMSARQIEAYAASGEPMGKAGAYGIQGRAAAHVQYLHGSYSGIMGLPLFETAEMLRELGWGCRSQPRPAPAGRPTADTGPKDGGRHGKIGAWPLPLGHVS